MNQFSGLLKTQSDMLLTRNYIINTMPNFGLGQHPSHLTYSGNFLTYID